MISGYGLAFFRIVIGTTFVISAAAKLRDLRSFASTIEQFNLIPTRLSSLAALVFVCAEAATAALMLLGGGLLWGGFALAALLLALFSAALASVLARRIRTSCNCFGVGSRMIAPIDVWRNVGLIVCALAGCAMLALADAADLALAPAEWLAVGLVAVVFAAAWLQIGEIVRLVRPS